MGPSAPERPEILAPAGSGESVAAALASDADAVYLGLSEGFNARRRADVFDLAGLPDLVRRAHAADVRVYLTLNTLVLEDELPALEARLRGVANDGRPVAAAPLVPGMTRVRDRAAGSSVHGPAPSRNVGPRRCP